VGISEGFIIAFIYIGGIAFVISLPVSFCHRLRDGTVVNLARSTTTWYFSVYYYFVASHMLWMASLAACVFSTFSCAQLGPYTYLYTSLHLNLATDIATTTEAIVCFLFRVIFIGEMSKWDKICGVGSIVVAVLGMASSACAVGGQTGGYAHFSVGWVMWAVGTVFREWSFWFT
jgi:hypothetical protein